MNRLSITHTRLLLLGAGDLAREVRQIAAGAAAAQGAALAVGYFADSADGARVPAADCVFGDLDALQERFPPGAWQAICCVGNPRTRSALHERFSALGYEFATLIGDNVTCESAPQTDAMGAGTVVFPGARIAIGVTLGRNVLINYNAMVGHDTVIGDHSVVGPGVNLGGRIDGGREVLYGIGASVLQGRRIGDQATVAAGSSAWTDVPAQTTVIGVPAMSRRLPR